MFFRAGEVWPRMILDLLDENGISDRPASIEIVAR